MAPIVVDISPTVNSKAGLGRYAHTLVAHLRDTWVGPHLYLFYNRRPGGVLPPDLTDLPARRVTLGYQPWRMLVWLAHLARVPLDPVLPPGTRLFHATEHLLLPLRDVPTVLTVHDLIYEHFPEHHKPLNRLFLTRAMPLFVRRARAIIAISHTTRRDLIARYRVPPERVHVVYEAPAPHFRPVPAERIAAVHQRYGLPERYLLTVGTIEPRKNLVRFLAAFERLRRDGLVEAWVLAGQRGWLEGPFFRRLAQSPARAHVRWLGYVPDADLPALYAGAQALVLPSLYEGFGLPLLEAMAVGTPVVASRGGALPEVGADAALYFDPYRVEDMVNVVGRVLDDPALQADLRERGRARAQAFSWARTARETAQVYARVLNGAA